jgi:hypothetical protein
MIFVKRVGSSRYLSSVYLNNGLFCLRPEPELSVHKCIKLSKKLTGGLSEDLPERIDKRAGS